MITTIIPTYGKPDLLQNAILSVQSQTYSDWELIVVDDNNPETVVKGEDTQLKMAVDELLKEIDSQKK